MIDRHILDNEPLTAQYLSRRYLKSFASGTAFMFAASANHYAWLAHHYGIARVTIDLLALKIEPAEFDISRNRTLAGMCRDSLLRNFQQLKPPGAVVSAMLFADFGIQDYWVEGKGFECIGTSTFTVVLTDDRGKEWRCGLTRKGMGADGDGFGDPNR